MKSKVCLIFLQGLGNSIINYPIFRQLRNDFDVTIVAFKNGSSAFYRELGAKVVEVENVREIYFKARSVKADYAFSLYPNWRRELAALTGVRAENKFHFTSTSRFAPLFPGKKLPSLKNRHDYENNLEILRTLGQSTKLKPDIADFKNKRDSNDSPYVVIHPTASTPHKYYARSIWMDIISYHEKKGYNTHIISGANCCEVDFCKSLKTDSTHFHIGTPFTHLINLISRSQYFIGHDSSMMHLASLFNRKVFALWSFADVRRIYPYSSEANIYMPEETLDATNYKYPTNKIPALKRAKSSTIIDILDGIAMPSAVQKDLAGNSIRLFTY